ncbi:VWA domain-containing protein [Cryptosporangium minutisporangium]|uniref:VWA domain-containing protein n=1 Tax=Cryptosporangium minutisporangium TaxID=113569 RepID=A0ABP6T0E6_9ACTN
MTMSIETHQNEFLPVDGRTVDAVLTVTGSGADGGAAPLPGEIAEVILIDTSGSMAGPKLVAAKEAAAAAIAALPDGIAFGIVEGDMGARLAYPPGKDLAVSSSRTREAARIALRGLRAGGGTGIGAWLTLARTLFARRGAAINHAILLTDGANGEAESTFDKALAPCVGQFVCDSRGVGTGWVARDLIKIAEQLHGTASGITDPSELTADFLEMTRATVGKTMAGVQLRVWTPTGAQVRFVKQVHPEITDLTDRRTDVSPRIGEYPIGTWGAETREYHLRVEVEPNPVGEEVLAARVSAVHGDAVLAQSLVRAVWTDDVASSTRIHRQVAHYSNETELAEAIQTGLTARAAGDVERATDRLGTAVRLAAEAGREDTAKMLAKVVDVIDESTGTVKLRPLAASIDVEMAAVGSRKTRQVRPEPPG